MNSNINAEVCVIGGGLTGLTTAYYLSKAGLDNNTNFTGATFTIANNSNYKAVLGATAVSCQGTGDNATLFAGEVFRV